MSPKDREITVKVDPEVLSRLPPEQVQAILTQGTLEALDVIADLLVELIKQNVNVDTGTMRGSVRKETVDDMISVIMGGDEFINPKTGKPCNYAPAQEAINPTFEPALDFLKDDIATLIEQRVLQKFAEAGLTVE